MIVVTVFIRYLSCERLWEHTRPFPEQVHANVTMNILDFKRKNSEEAESNFVYTLNYTPSIGQLNIRGAALVKADQKEIEELLNAHEQKKPPPPAVYTQVMTTCFTFATLLNHAVNLPFPLPLPPPPREQKPPEPSKIQPYR